MGKKAKKRARSATRPESSGPNEPAKKRPKVHGAVSKCSVLGKPHGAEAKAVLATVYENLTEMRATRKRGRHFDEEFKMLTGAEASTVRRWLRPKKQTTGNATATAGSDANAESGADSNANADAGEGAAPASPVFDEGGNMDEPEKPGPKKKDPRLDLEDFYEWVAEKVEKAKLKGFVTAKTLKDDLWEENGYRVSKVVLKRTLRLMGFTYAKRKGVWTSRRAEPGVQDKLRKFLTFVVLNSEKVETVKGGVAVAKYTWQKPLAFFDETYLWTIMQRDWGWCLKTDKTKEKIPKGAPDHRASILHTLFSHLVEQPLNGDGAPAAFVTWREHLKGAGAEFKGPCTADHIHRYASKYISPHLGSGGVLVLDNCSTHKEFKQRLDEMTTKEIHDFIVERENNAGNKMFNTYEKGLEGVSKNKKLYRAALSKWVRERNLRDLTLCKMLQEKGIAVWYTPAYHPECQPIERWWAAFKRRFEDTDPGLQFKVRVSLAHSAMPDDFAQKCIQSALRWCWKKHALLVDAAAPPAQPAVVFDPDDLDSGSEGE